MPFKDSLRAPMRVPASAPPPTELSCVELIDVMGEWFVRVTEKDGNSATRTFEHKDYAVSFAEGQKTRLGLDEVTRIYARNR